MTIMELQAFGGMVNLVRRFISHYTKDANPLAVLTQKDSDGLPTLGRGGRGVGTRGCRSRLLLFCGGGQSTVLVAW